LTKDHQNQQPPVSNMKILVIGESSHFAECKTRFDGFEVHHAQSHHDGRSFFGKSSVVFDFIIDEDRSQLHFYSGCTLPVFLNSVKSSLRELVEQDTTGAKFFGFNGLLTFINRPIIEVTLRREEDRQALGGICEQLKTPFEIVADEPGMVSARVVCMIVNEAFSTIEDGTASSDDIDLAMKLGTNYPKGPVEWGRKMGLRNVCDVLDALYRSSGNERYIVCTLLREESKRE
jgi:3-hydroxybutyryl-CoA dehydrogenase